MTSAVRLQEEIARQRQRLNADLVPRQIGVALSCLLFLAFVPFWYVFLIYLISVGSEIIQRRYLRICEAQPTWRNRALVLLNSAIAIAAYSSVALVLWKFDDPMARFVGTLAPIGALLNISVMRAIHLPLGIASALPAALALLALPAQELLIYGLTIPGLVAMGAAGTLVAYFLSALIQNHRSHAALLNALAEARAAGEAKTRFLSTMSHEIRTPLNALSGHSDLLMSETHPDQVKDHARQIASASMQIHQMLETALDLSLLTDGTLSFRPATTAIHKEIRSAPINRDPSHPTRVTVEIAPDVPEYGRLDPALLRRSIAHICALVADPLMAAEIRLRCTISPSTPERLIITATGTPAATRDDPRENGRNDIFVDLASGLAERMGGRLVLMRAPNGGRVARLELPFVPLPDPPAGGAESVYGTLRALVVDDIPSNRFVLCQLLRSLRIDTIEAKDGNDALEWLNAEPFDVVLLDINMPGMDGTETLKKIRETDAAWSKIPVIAITADSVTWQRDLYLSMGFDGYLTKPLERRLLWAEILATVPPPPPL
ncbi:phospho-acceptor domain-containing protein [Albidovulum inexpectatum]|uniref:histidine kinase n=1 Tax=Albidovulum inexpectatum TaxID=196587 RepID=A0A2S5JDP9_9RHOB|nr:response regulator [Albidovulum inexpectatum]PPB79528.1 phospho-acceptor domain-containing protein [Albidovulum inexpectatum]